MSATRDLYQFRKEHQSADQVRMLKELSMIKDNTMHFFTFNIDVFSQAPFEAHPTNAIGTRARIPVESIRPHIKPRGDNIVYQMGLADSFLFCNPPTAPPNPFFFPLPFLVRVRNFGVLTDRDFVIFPGVNNTSQAIKTSNDFPQSYLELEYGKGQGALPDSFPAGPITATAYTKAGDQTSVSTTVNTTSIVGIDDLIDYNLTSSPPQFRPSQYLLTLACRFWLRTITMI